MTSDRRNLRLCGFKTRRAPLHALACPTSSVFENGKCKQPGLVRKWGDRRPCPRQKLPAAGFGVEHVRGSSPFMAKCREPLCPVDKGIVGVQKTLGEDKWNRKMGRSPDNSPCGFKPRRSPPQVAKQFATLAIFQRVGSVNNHDQWLKNGATDGA